MWPGSDSAWEPVPPEDSPDESSASSYHEPCLEFGCGSLSTLGSQRRPTGDGAAGGRAAAAVAAALLLVVVAFAALRERGKFAGGTAREVTPAMSDVKGGVGLAAPSVQEPADATKSEPWVGLDCSSTGCELRPEVQNRLHKALGRERQALLLSEPSKNVSPVSNLGSATQALSSPPGSSHPAAAPIASSTSTSSARGVREGALSNGTTTTVARPGVSEPVACSMSGEDCTRSKCCKEPGLQCFEKKRGAWATCRPGCMAGPDPTDENEEPWTCKALGPRSAGETPTLVALPKAAWVDKLCSGDGEDCIKSRCCKDAGMQCFMKDERWATCRADCLSGPDLTDVNSDPWTCAPLGSRTPGAAAKRPPTPVPKWVASDCSKPGEDCSRSRCCALSGMQCFEKKAKEWAACKVTCAPGEADPDDRDSAPWSCAELGPRTGEASWHDPSLYCFSIIRDTGYEPELVREQLPLGIGIFACDEYGLYSTGSTELGEDVFGPVATISFPGAEVGTSKDGTAANTALFLNAWDAVNRDGRLWNHDFTVKVDPDAVLLPDRLRNHLRPHTGSNVFVVNCNKPGMTPMMFGSVEVFSFQAMQTYFAGSMTCRGTLPIDSWGEDLFIGECLKTLGTSPLDDFSMVQDGVCKGVWCQDPEAAAFHPFKTLEGWMDCYQQTQR